VGVPTFFLASDEGDPGGRVLADSHPVAVKAGTSTSIDEQDVLALWRLLRRLGVSNADADDATQEVYLIVAERRAEILPGKERAFVYGTALRVARSRLRRRDRSVELDEPATAADDAPGIEDLLDQHEARKILDELLEQMPFELRAVFVLFEMEELSSIEIAEALDIPRGTAASRLRRAREDFQTRVARLRARLAHRGAKP
jgi:RNA polymerase sigma-70 factor (ECF subfamily)